MTFQPALVTEEHPLELKGTLPKEEIAVEEPWVRTEEPVQVELLVRRDGSDFLVTGWLKTSFELLCGRCADWMPWPVRAEFNQVIEAPHPNSIDLTPLIREDILLTLPLNAACTLGADGRCPVTGEIHRPRPETSVSFTSEAVWEALNKIKPKD